MNASRVGAEIRRELTRPTGPWTPVVVLVLAGLLGLFAALEAGVDAYVLATYLVLPLFLCPLAAQRVAADREEALTAVQATTPLTRGEFLLGKIVALGILLAASLALTLPLLYALTETLAPGSFQSALPLVAWGGLVGGVAIVVGLLVGYSTPGTTGALSIAFGVVFAWVLLPALSDRLLDAVETETGLQIVRAVLHASPLTWALEAKQTNAVDVLAGHTELAIGLAGLLLALLVVLGAIALGLQRFDGWVEHPARHPLAIAFLALGLLGAAATLAMVQDPPAQPDQGVPSDAGDARIGDLHVNLDPDRDIEWRAETPLAVELTIAGPPNATVQLTRLELGGPNLTVHHDLDVPTTVELTEIREGHGTFAPEGETYGVASLEFQATATPHRITTGFLLEADVGINGNETVLATGVTAFDWGTPGRPALLGGGLPLAIGLGAAIVVPRRANRW